MKNFTIRLTVVFIIIFAVGFLQFLIEGNPQKQDNPPLRGISGSVDLNRG